MKTILCIFTTTPVTDTEVLAKTKKYSFNSNSDLKVGDMIKSSRYKGKLVQVVEILEDSYEFYNVKTGVMSNEQATEYDFPINMIGIVDVEDETIYGTLVK